MEEDKVTRMAERMMKMTWILGCATLGLSAMGCSDSGEGSGSGTVSVLLEAEDTIIEGIEPGTSSESIRDGWRVRFSQYVVAIGDIVVRRATDAGVSKAAADVFVVDLTAIAAAGTPLWKISDVEDGEWDFSYSTPAANGADRVDDSVPASDFAEVTAAQATYLVAGSVTKEDGQSCPPAALATPPAGAVATGMNKGGDVCYANTSVSFRWVVPAATSFGPCEIDEVPGFSVAANQTTTVAATIHGDHLFFNGFPEGSEGGIVRVAQWLADCDLNLDGEVSQSELLSIAPADLAEVDDRFQLGGSPITPLSSMWIYLRAQLMTQGHFQGEGECPFGGG